MAVPKRKTSKSKTASRKAQNMKRSITRAGVDPESGTPAQPHRVCKATGKYRGRQVVTVSDAE